LVSIELTDIILKISIMPFTYPFPSILGIYLILNYENYLK
jgi:hypothetical protein